MKSICKKTILGSSLILILVISHFSATAREMDMYVSGHKLWREISSVQGFDMVPVLDIAAELGFSSSFDGTKASIWNDYACYTFEKENPTVHDDKGNLYGLDIVPQYIKGRFMIPAKFFKDVLKYSYVYDSVTDAVFLNSENEYNWTIANIPEHRVEIGIYTDVNYGRSNTVYVYGTNNREHVTFELFSTNSRGTRVANIRGPVKIVNGKGTFRYTDSHMNQGYGTLTVHSDTSFSLDLTTTHFYGSWCVQGGTFVRTGNIDHPNFYGLDGYDSIY